MKRRIVTITVVMLTLLLLAGCGSSLSSSGAASSIAPGSGVESTAPEPTAAPETELTEQQEKARAYMERQAKTDAQLKEEMQSGYTLEQPLVIVNPYELSPLTALVGFHSDTETAVTVTVQGKDTYSNISHTFEEFSTQHLVPVYGLYADQDNQVEFTLTARDGSTQTSTLTIRTEALPDDISQIEVKACSPDRMAAGLTFVDTPRLSANYRYAFDCNGDIRWFISDKTFSGTLMLLHLRNGNFLIPSGDMTPDSIDNMNCIYEITPLGRFVNEYHAYGVHHDARELSNGNLLFAASREGSGTHNDYIIELDRKTGEQLRDWDLQEIIPMASYSIAPPYNSLLGDDMWLHNNAIWYLEDEDAFIISGRDQDMVMKFDASTKEIRWILSETIGAQNEQLRPYLLTPVNDGSEFEYPCGQHAAMQTPEGDLMVFDNRNQNILNEDGTVDQSKLWSRAVRYEINEEQMTVRQIWQYGKERGSELYSSVLSDVDYLADGHYLINFGSIYALEDGSNCDAFLSPRENMGAAKKQAAVVEVVDNEVVFEVSITGAEGVNANTYKAERKDIYLNAQEMMLQ